jgi:uncharacterized membrane protein YkvI
MDEYTASPLEQLIPSRLSRFVLVTMLPIATSAAGIIYSYANQIDPSLPSSERNLWAALICVTILLFLSWAIILDLALLFKAKKHSRIFHHH